MQPNRKELKIKQRLKKLSQLPDTLPSIGNDIGSQQAFLDSLTNAAFLFNNTSLDRVENVGAAPSTRIREKSINFPSMSLQSIDLTSNSRPIIKRSTKSSRKPRRAMSPAAQTISTISTKRSSGNKYQPSENSINFDFISPAGKRIKYRLVL